MEKTATIQKVIRYGSEISHNDSPYLKWSHKICSFTEEKNIRLHLLRTANIFNSIYLKLQKNFCN